jgi:hypothetical protein
MAIVGSIQTYMPEWTSARHNEPTRLGCRMAGKARMVIEGKIERTFVNEVFNAGAGCEGLAGLTVRGLARCVSGSRPGCRSCGPPMPCQTPEEACH